jgi:anti-sigma B factor antagonist
MLTVTSTVEGDRIAVQLAGRLDGSPCCTSLSEVVKEHLGRGSRRFVLDLRDLEWMSSCGIGCLIASYSSVRRAGGSMALRDPNDRVLATLKVTDLVPGVFALIESRTPAPAGIG